MALDDKIEIERNVRVLIIKDGLNLGYHCTSRWGETSEQRFKRYEFRDSLGEELTSSLVRVLNENGAEGKFELILETITPRDPNFKDTNLSGGTTKQFQTEERFARYKLTRSSSGYEVEQVR